jgi:CheY-like chemotaxis protein
MAHILVIDDQPGIRNCFRTVLETAGHAVRDAADGAAGPHAARSGPFDLVLCDLFMPDTDGMQVIRELRREFPALPVVAMSGGGFNGQLDILPLARYLGADHPLHKPCTVEEVLEVLRRALGADSGVPPSGEG